MCTGVDGETTVIYHGTETAETEGKGLGFGRANLGLGLSLRKIFWYPTWVPFGMAPTAAPGGGALGKSKRGGLDAGHRITERGTRGRTPQNPTLALAERSVASDEGPRGGEGRPGVALPSSAGPPV